MASASLSPLPAISSIGECAELTKVVYPYLHQLSPAHFLPLVRGEIAPTAWYLATNPLISALLFSLAVSLFTFSLAEVNRNYSQVDRLWGILPALYISHFALWAHASDIASERVDTLATFSALWGVRLTFNFWRKGGYSIGHEDYRWAILRTYIPAPAFVVFDLVFIAFWQNIVLLAITLPAYVLLLISQLPGSAASNIGDTIFSRALLVLLALETLADQQQWAFQSAKKAYLKSGTVPVGWAKEDLDRGFLVGGLWSFCRHPNFLCEQMIWVAVYQWACWQTDTIYNWAGAGVAAYLGIFYGSTIFTESITVKKYKEYEEYQKLVNKFVPGLNIFSGFAESMTAVAAAKKQQ